MKKLKSIKYCSSNKLKVGDDVFIGDIKEYDGKDCPICKSASEIVLIEDKQLCSAHRIYFAVEELTDGNHLSIVKWKDGSHNFRAGINWYSDTKYDFICEKPSLVEALECCVKFIRNKVTM